MKLLITLILTLFLFGCSSDSEVIPPIMPYSYSTTELDLVNKVNDYRITNGLSTLEPVEHIGYLCSEHNQNMINTTVVGHQNFEGRINNLKLTMGAIRVSELVASNYSTNQSVMSAFLNDPLCKQILDEQDRNRIGVAVTISPTGRKYYTLIIIK
jgi:uncharacterized protein YkwD